MHPSGSRSRSGVDLLILGAGPAGCAAAIRARQEGLSVKLFESARGKPKRVPGETLHPGIEPLFKQLGVLEDVVAAGFRRHRGVWLVADERKELSCYGEDERGPWLGFQTNRPVLHHILRRAATQAGAQLQLGVRPQNVLQERGRVVGVMTNEGETRARWTVDATGRNAWLARELNLAAEIHSQPLGVRFGWRAPPEGGIDTEPTFFLHRSGWDWQAPVDDDTVAWAELRIGSAARPRPPGIDFTWKHRPASAGPGYFLLGDAASVLDPSSSHGVLRAVMTGVLCGYLASRSRRGDLTESEVLNLYRSWVSEQFSSDVASLRELYEASFAKVA